MDSTPASILPSNSSSIPSLVSQQQQRSNDILDLFGSDSTTATNLAPSPYQNSPPSQPSLPNSSMMPPSSSSSASAAPPLPDALNNAPSPGGGGAGGGNVDQTEHEAYNRNNLRVMFRLARDAEGNIQVAAHFRNTSSDGGETISSLALQAAVPRTQRLQLQAISRTTLEPVLNAGIGGIGDFGGGQSVGGGDGRNEARQLMRIVGSRGVSLSLSLSLLPYFHLSLLHLFSLSSFSSSSNNERLHLSTQSRFLSFPLFQPFYPCITNSPILDLATTPPFLRLSHSVDDGYQWDTILIADTF